jgi:hypothetical protein
VFGQSQLGKKITYLENGNKTEINVSQFLRKTFLAENIRYAKPIRLLFNFLDEVYIGAKEKELKQNVLNIRAYVKTLIL